MDVISIQQLVRTRDKGVGGQAIVWTLAGWLGRTRRSS